MTSTLDAFYDECAEAIWEHDGLLNKTIGDAIMAVFNFPIRQIDHAAQAVRAARQMQQRWRIRRLALWMVLASMKNASAQASAAAISVLASSGSRIATLPQSVLVNTAARAQSAARTGQILVTKVVRDRCEKDILQSGGRTYGLKGLVAPVELYDTGAWV